jgi:hypothetical protein
MQRGAIGLVAGAIAALAAVMIVYGSSPGLALEMDRDPRAVIEGTYDFERVERETYAWTRDQATMRLPGLDRRHEWSCTIRVRGGRADESTLPQVVVSVDGVIATTVSARNDFQDVSVALPPRPRLAGAVVTLASSNTFVPGPNDRRPLGVVIDRWACAAEAGGTVRPPRTTLIGAAVAGAAFGAAFSLLSTGILLAIGGTLLLAVAQAVPLTWEYGMFTPYPTRAAWLALWIGAILVVAVRGAERVMGRPLSGAARFTAAVTAAVLYLKLLALLHPSKHLVDVVFHAHRLQWVLDGRFYFTQPMPDGVRFPYAIGLYVISIPFTWLTSDFVLLLRIVVSAAEAIGALLVYRLVSHLWTDRLGGACAALLYHLVPRTFEIVGNANMTNAFAQSAALAALAAAVLLPLHRGAWLQMAALTALTALALLSHISTFTLLGGILFLLAVLYWFRGGDELRQPALAVCSALLIAAVLSIAVYYAHFGEAYRTAVRVRATPPASAPAISGPTGAAGGASSSVSLAEKAREAARLTVAAVGWPIFVLASGGVVLFWRRGLRDRLSLALLALLLTLALFIVAVVAMPVERSFQRYAAEFISRVTLATYPALVILAGTAVAWAFGRGWGWRLAAVAGMLAATAVGATTWVNWIR